MNNLTFERHDILSIGLTNNCIFILTQKLPSDLFNDSLL